MKEYTAQELGERIAAETENVTEIYFQVNGKDKKLSKELWAWLHLGILAGLKLGGYNDEKLFDDALEIAHGILSKY